MFAFFVIVLSLIFLYALCLVAGLYVSFLILKKTLREHQERWRLG